MLTGKGPPPFPFFHTRPTCLNQWYFHTYWLQRADPDID